MSHRTWILIAALAAAPLFVAGSALAQDGAPPGGAHMHPHGHGRHHGRGGFEHGGPGRRVEMLVAILGLDAHQEASVRQIFEASRPRFQEIRQMTDPAARQAAMQALHQQTRASIDAVLTPEQRATLDRVEAVRRAHGPRGPGRGPAPAPGARPSGI